jgi:hypothetical protein
VAGALRDHHRRADVEGLLVELDEGNVDSARAALGTAGLDNVTAVAGDAGVTTPYAAAAPADIVLACGVFGNISNDDVLRTITALPMLCATGATVIWTRHRHQPDLTPDIRAWFRDAGFDELAFESPGEDRYSVGAHRLGAAPQTYQPDVPLFTFIR